MKDRAREMLESGEVDLFLGYRIQEGHPLPYFFSRDRPEEIEDIVPGPARYPLEKMAMAVASRIPDIRIGLLCRDCNQRTLNVLTVCNQIDPDRIKTVNVNCCPSGLRDHADCSYLERGKEKQGRKEEGWDRNMDPGDVEKYPPGERFTRWMYEFQKCIKCYGCRNICPVCFCRSCSLESPDLVKTGDSPPEVPLFHLIRAVHMAGRCIDCGLCEDACPMDIPLRLLYRKVNEIVKEVFQYETGTSLVRSPFNLLGDEMILDPDSILEDRPRQGQGR